jgi:hypothetical protein
MMLFPYLGCSKMGPARIPAKPSHDYKLVYNRMTSSTRTITDFSEVMMKETGAGLVCLVRS